jgi:DNA-binding GntR family transcriptional regulator
MDLEEVEKIDWPANVGSRETAYEFAYRVLRRTVLDGTFQEGARLYQTEIGQRLGVSTTPVREALHKLASEGLVDFDAGRGAIVHVLSADERSEIRRIRGLLEPVALRLSAEHIDSQAIAEEERLYREMEGETDVVAWVDLNREFHSVHYLAAKSPRLARILMVLLDANTTYLVRAIIANPEIARLAQEQHAAIIEGLRRHDGDALEEIAVRHLMASLLA